MKDQASTWLYGGADPGSTMRMGIVQRVNPATHTVDVLLDNNEHINSVPILGTVGSIHGSDLVWLQDLRGASVVLLYVGRKYHVLTTIPNQTIRRDSSIVSELHTANVGGSAPESYGKNKFLDFSQNRPRSFFPGDKVIRAEGSTELGLFKGGLAWLKVGPMCQIILAKLKDLIRIVARTVQIYTDFGEITIGRVGDGTKVGLELKGGAIPGETSAAAPTWTVQCALGYSDSGETNRLMLRVNDAANAEYVTMTLGTDGSFVQTISKDRELTVLNDDKLTISGDRAHTVVGNETHVVNGTLTIHSSTGVKLFAPRFSVNS